MSLDLLFPNFETLIRTPEDVARLNEAILQLAVQGKLVPQDPADEPAGELLKRIRAEKQRLIQTNTISDRSEDVSIDEAKIPYSLPKAWRWVPVGDVCHFERGISFPASAKEEIPTRENIACLRTTNVQEEVDWRDLIYVSPSYVSGEAKKVRLHDVLISMANSYELVGKVSYVGQVPFEASFGGFIAALRCFGGVFPKYLYYCFKSGLMQGLIRGTSNQTTNIANISLRGTYPLPFPLPPLAEQRRIVAKVESLFAQTRALEAKLRQAQADIVTVNRAALNRLSVAADADAFAAAWVTVRDAFDLLYDDPRNVAELRHEVLQLAVQGKLVPQDPADEPAGELLKRIRAERRRLVKEGKLDKVRELQPVKPTEFPFALPPEWALVRLGELVTKLGAGSTPLGGRTVYEDKGIKFIRSQNVWDDGLRLDDVAMIPDSIHERMSGTVVVPKDILLNITGASIGRSAIVPDDFDTANVSQHVAIVRLIEPEVRRFIHICLISPYLQRLIMSVEVGISREGLSMSRLQYFVLPLPPLTEQHRIVAKVDQLMQQCNALAAGLARAEGQRRALTAAALHGAFG